MEAAGLWVVGSYARGALTCGDLDLVFEVKATSGPRPVRGAAKAFIGAPAGVRVYIGTPTENSSGTHFDEAVLVWKPGLDWEAALSGIPVDPTASRFARVGDQVPLRVEQHLLELPVIEDLVRLREQGVLSWRFVPLSAIPHTLEPRNRWEERTLRLFSEQSAMKRKLAPVVFSFARQLAAERSIGAQIELDSYPGNFLKVGGVRIHVERLWLRADTLDELDCTGVAFIPALSTRGPNGFWLVERGPNHPVVQAFDGVRVWTHANADGTPCLITAGAQGAEGRMVEAETFEVFESEQQAQQWADELYEDDDEEDRDERKLMPKLLEGAEVLEVLACVDAVTPHAGEEFATTRRGLAYCLVHGEEQEVLAPAEVAHRLREAAAAQ